MNRYPNIPVSQFQQTQYSNIPILQIDIPILNIPVSMTNIHPFLVISHWIYQFIWSTGALLLIFINDLHGDNKEHLGTQYILYYYRQISPCWWKVDTQNSVWLISIVYTDSSYSLSRSLTCFTYFLLSPANHLQNQLSYQAGNLLLHAETTLQRKTDCLPHLWWPTFSGRCEKNRNHINIQSKTKQRILMILFCVIAFQSHLLQLHVINT